jgi:hypothetical protein
VGAGQHDLDGEVSLIGVAGAQGFERLDRGNEAAPVVLGIVDYGWRQGIAEFGVVFLPGEGAEAGYWGGSGLVNLADYK